MPESQNPRYPQNVLDETIEGIAQKRFEKSQKNLFEESQGKYL